MNVVKFIEEFPDELSCKIHLKSAQEKEQIKCKKCSSTKHWWLESKWMW